MIALYVIVNILISIALYIVVAGRVYRFIRKRTDLISEDAKFSAAVWPIALVVWGLISIIKPTGRLLWNLGAKEKPVDKLPKAKVHVR